MTQTLIGQIERFIEDRLKGIDETETDSPDGWWETSTGADFGEGVLSDLRAIIEQAKAEKQEPFGYVLSINGELVFKKKITESESLVYSSVPVHCGNHMPVPSSVLSTPQPDIVAELVKALEDDAYAATFQSMAGYRTALIAKVKGMVG